MLDAQNNRIMITSPCPNSGKTFTATNLASILAKAGKRVLLVDGDMRRGDAHLVFGMERGIGLSDVIAGSHSLGAVIHQQVLDNLDFISTGTLPPQPSELILNPKFEETLVSVSPKYDIVLIDAPPVLAVTDAALIGSHCGTTLLNLRYGLHPLTEIVESTRRLLQAGVSLKGALLNAVPRNAGRYGRYVNRYYSYGYARADK
jgi:tyrosine-protein kinase Etk/Wzc